MIENQLTTWLLMGINTKLMTLLLLGIFAVLLKAYQLSRDLKSEKFK